MNTSGTKTALPPHPVLHQHFDNEAGRRLLVRSLFDTTAKSYDVINTIMSFGTGERYRLEALNRAGLAAGQSVMDVGCGTGVIARHEMEIVGAQGFVVAVDPSHGMLCEAKNRGIPTVAMGRGESLPFSDDSFDFITMGYALRHVADLNKAFAEYFRVLKPGGKLLLLEIAPPDTKLGYHLVRIYMKHIIPWLARLVTRDKNARLLMSYYWDTVEQCVPPATILGALQDTGFERAQRKVMFKVFGEYTAIKAGA